MTENVFEDKALQKYLNEIAEFDTISREEEKKLAKRAKKGDQEAINKLIRANLKFVVKIASRYQNRGLKLSELISEGNMGLIKAIEKFDPSKDIKLISYAVWWIKQRILFALAEKTSLIRMPLGKSNSANKIRAAKEKVFNRTGKVATIDDIAKETDIKKKTIKSLESKNKNPLSIDDVSYSNDSSKVKLKDFIKDETADDPRVVYYEDKVRNTIEKSIEKLNDRERFIIKSYFGLGDEPAQNYAQIAEKLNLSRERVRQIQKEGLQKMLKDVSSEMSQDINSFLMK